MACFPRAPALLSRERDSGSGAAGQESAYPLSPVPAEATSRGPEPQHAPHGGAAGGGGRQHHGRGECRAGRPGECVAAAWAAAEEARGSNLSLLSAPGRADPEGVYGPELSAGPPLAGAEDPSRPPFAGPQVSRGAGSLVLGLGVGGSPGLGTGEKRDRPWDWRVEELAPG